MHCKGFYQFLSFDPTMSNIEDQLEEFCLIWSSWLRELLIKLFLMKLGIPLLGMIVLALSGCSAVQNTVVVPAAPSVVPTDTARPPTATAIPRTPTPLPPPAISASNFQELQPLSQWEVGDDVVRVTGVALSPLTDSVALLTVHYPETYTVELRNTKTGALLWSRVLKGKQEYGALDFSADGSRVAVGQSNGQVQIWNASDGSLAATLEGPAYAVRALAFSPDGTRLAASGSDSLVHLWNLSNGELTAQYPLKDNVGNLVFSPDGRYLAAASGSFALFDLSSESGAPIYIRDPGTPHSTGEIAFSPDGATFIAEGERNDVNHNSWIPRLLFWELTERDQPASWKIALENPVQNLVVLPDGGAVLGYDPLTGQLDLIDVGSKSVVGTLDLGSVALIDYSHDLRRFVALQKTSITLWGLTP